MDVSMREFRIYLSSPYCCRLFSAGRTHRLGADHFSDDLSAANSTPRKLMDSLRRFHRGWPSKMPVETCIRSSYDLFVEDAVYK